MKRDFCFKQLAQPPPILTTHVSYIFSLISLPDAKKKKLGDLTIGEYGWRTAVVQHLWSHGNKNGSKLLLSFGNKVNVCCSFCCLFYNKNRCQRKNLGSFQQNFGPVQQQIQEGYQGTSCQG